MSEAAEDAGLTAEVWDRGSDHRREAGRSPALPPGLIGRPDSSWSSTNPTRLTLISVSSEGNHLRLGGLSIKTAQYMEEMKDDMSGAAAVVAATTAIARLGSRGRVTTVVPLTDNAVGGKATRPGDVLGPSRGPPSRCSTPTPRDVSSSPTGWEWFAGTSQT